MRGQDGNLGGGAVGAGEATHLETQLMATRFLSVCSVLRVHYTRTGLRKPPVQESGLRSLRKLA